jgi:hypothetical protein
MNNLLNKWVSLNDALPDISATVLVVSKANEVFIAQLYIGPDGNKCWVFQFNKLRMNLNWASMWRYL